MAEITNSPYAYVWNDPVNYADPTGLMGERKGGPGHGPKTIQDCFGGGDGGIQASRRLPASERPGTVYMYGKKLGNSAKPYQDYYNSLSQSQIHSMRVGIYERSMGAYDTGVARAMYGLDNNEDINVPESIKEREWSASGYQVFNKIKDDFATQYSGVDPSSLNGVFNPIANAQWMSARALAVTSNREAKGMIAQTAMQTAPAYFVGHVNLKPNIGIFGANEGWGWFGKNGLKVGNYKMEAMYMDSKGGGTFFSIKQMKNSGASHRLDWGAHKSMENYFHIHSRFYIRNRKIGSTKPWPNK
nr:hypothetical protein [uncultured Chryseobacterium sp.]